jgi:hypothetical protein
MTRPRRRLNWVRVTRDPGVAAAHERSAQASAEWHLALLGALRPHPGTLAPNPFPFPSITPNTPRIFQYRLPFVEDATPA